MPMHCNLVHYEKFVTGKFYNYISVPAFVTFCLGRTGLALFFLKESGYYLILFLPNLFSIKKQRFGSFLFYNN
jgi:hypothetical protein